MLRMYDITGDVEAGKMVAADMNGQVAWGDVIADRFTEFDYQDDIAVVWHVARRGNPISIDPRVAFGAPSVSGIPTWILKGRWDAGETIRHIQDDYGLSQEDIIHALRFEDVPQDELTTVR